MPKKKKPKAVMVDGIAIKPISPAEHRRLDRRIKKKYESCGDGTLRFTARKWTGFRTGMARIPVLRREVHRRKLSPTIIATSLISQTLRQATP